jgi:muramidase (phage lysozyme)
LSARYHPDKASVTDEGQPLSFEPQYQDAVVLAWLSDRKAWGNLPQQLRDGDIRKVLKRLSGTWTSLGYGIETNVMSAELPRIYKQLLEAELERARAAGGVQVRP